MRCRGVRKVPRPDGAIAYFSTYQPLHGDEISCSVDTDLEAAYGNDVCRRELVCVRLCQTLHCVVLRCVRSMCGTSSSHEEQSHLSKLQRRAVQSPTFTKAEANIPELKGIASADGKPVSVPAAEQAARLLSVVLGRGISLHQARGRVRNLEASLAPAVRLLALTYHECTPHKLHDPVEHSSTNGCMHDVLHMDVQIQKAKIENGEPCSTGSLTAQDA